jgi:hypothetical protein
MLTTAPCTTKCNVVLSNKTYGLNQSLAPAFQASVQFRGSGAALDWSLPRDIYGGTVPPPITGTHLSFLITSLSGAAIQLIAPAANQFQNGTGVSFSKLTLDGGAGFDAAGGGNWGVKSANYSNVVMDQVYIDNFLSGGWLSEGSSATSGGYFVLNNFNRGYVTLNGGPAFGLGPNGANLENFAVTHSEVEGNGGPAVDINNGNVQGFTYADNLSQWNNVAAAAADIKFEAGGAASGCIMDGNYWEIDALLGGVSNAVVTNSAGAIGCKWGDGKNFIAPAAVPRFLVFSASASGKALPACSSTSIQLNNSTAYVSDATACTAGTTYAGGGVASTTATFTKGSTTLTVASSTGIAIGQGITAAGVPIQAIVTNLSGTGNTTITISEATTAAGSGAAVVFGVTCRVICSGSAWRETGSQYPY